MKNYYDIKVPDIYKIKAIHLLHAINAKMKQAGIDYDFWIGNANRIRLGFAPGTFDSARELRKWIKANVSGASILTIKRA